RKTLAWSFERFENFIARRCAVVVCATPHIADRYAMQRINNVDVNNYPIPGELSKDEPDIATSSAGADTRSICYIGGVTRVRGAVEMI
ncbi:hypothetical protein ACOICT_29150, partial [Klebsiella pneumoniae]